MPRVATPQEVLLAANYKAQQKKLATNQANILGVPSLPSLPSTALVQGVVEMTFVGPTYNPDPTEVWALIIDPQEVTALDRRHRQDNMDPGRAGLPRKPIYSAETPYAIVRTVE